MLPEYAELHCLTNFSFLRGASHPEELAARAAKLGYAALAVTDECSLAGVVRAHVAAKEHGLKLIVGAEFRLADGPKLVLLATDREAYSNLSQLITAARRRSRKGSYRIVWDDLDAGVPGCLALLVPDEQPKLKDAQRLARLFPGRAWIAAELTAGRTTGRGSKRCLISAAPRSCRSPQPATCTCTCARAGRCRTR